MSIASHLEELRKKHQKLSDSVERAQRSPGTNAIEVTAMKREKLRLKEEISKLST